MSGPSRKLDGDPGTTGHIWDGIEEFTNPMPRWWVWTFYATIIWGIVYMFAYPAWPMLRSSTAGFLGWSTRANVVAEIQTVQDANASVNSRLVSTKLTEISEDPDLVGYATQAGAAVFHTWCAQCHGSGAAGVQASGYPNLLDDDWIWGGDIGNIHYTISHGIRSEADDDTRYSEMTAFAGILDEHEIDSVANYVLTLSGQAPNDASRVAEGAVVFEENCASCHGEAGSGDIDQGAPDLTDAIWLYGGDYDTIVETVSHGRFGVMPNWNTRLTEAQIRAVATYVHGLGGGR